MHREKPHKLLQVGVTPTPATNFKGKRSGCWSVKPVSQKQVGSDEWSITTASHQPSPATKWRAKAAAPQRAAKAGVTIRGKASARQAIWTRSSISPDPSGLSAGGLRVQVPSGPPFFRSVAQSSERPAWDREAAGGNPAIPTKFNLLPWSNT